MLEKLKEAELNKENIEKKKGIKLKKINSIELSISKNDLSSHLGTILETLSRTFKKLQDEKIIEVDSKKITILDFQKLKEISK